MDMYDRLMKLPTTGLTILEIFADNPEKKWLLIRELAAVCEKKIFDGPVDRQTLEALRTVLCYEYRSLINAASEVPSRMPVGSHPADLGKFIVRATDYSPNSEEFCLLYDVTTLQLALLWDEKQFARSLKCFQQMHKEHLETGYPSAGLFMWAFECFADSYNLRSLLYKVEHVEKECQELLDCILKMIELWMNQEGSVEWKTLASLLPKLVSIFGVRRIITPLWNRVLGDWIDPGRSLAVLCVTADVCFPTEGTLIGETYYEHCVREEFWMTLLRGLLSEIYQQRKQALYLVKRALDYVESHKSLRVELQLGKETFLPFVCRYEVANEQAANVTKINFFLILESLEEKQKHLVLPALTHLPDLIDACFGQKSRSYTFNVVWLRCVFKRILRHDNTAIMIHGLREILKADLALYDEELMDFLVNSLNNINLYERDEIDEQPPDIVTQLIEFFFRSDAAEVPLINTFVRAVSTVSWCPVAICWTLRAVVEVTKRRAIVRNFWGPEEMKCVKNLVENNLTRHGKALQRQSQCLILQAFCAYTRENSCWSDVKLVSDTLIIMHECRRDPGVRWIEDITKHVSRIIKPVDAQLYVSRNCDELLDSGMSVESHARTIILFLEANLIVKGKDCLAERSLRRLFQNLIGASLRPYADVALIDKILELVGHLMRASNLSEHGQILNWLVTPYLDATLKLIEKSFDKAEITNYDEYLTAIDAFIRNGYCQNSDDLARRLKSLRNKCTNVIVDPKKCTKQRWLYALMALNLYLRENDFYVIELSKTNLQPALTHFKDNILNDPEQDSSKGRYAWACCDNIAFLILRYIEHADLSLQNTWLEDFQLLVQTGTERVIAPVAKMLLHLLNCYPCLIVENIDKVDSIVRLSWQSVFQLNKTEVFFDAVTNLTRVMVHPGIQKLDSLKEFALQCIDQLMEEGKKVPSLRHIFTTVMLSEPRQNVVHYVKPLLCCLLHGEIPRHDQNIERAAISYFKKEDRNFAGDVNNRIRAESLFALLAILNVKGNEKFRVMVLRDNLSILEKHRNKRYFDNSHVHRLKHRVMQTLLILEPYLSEAERRELYAAMCDLLIAESNQPSVRLMQEWLLVRIYANSFTQDSVWTLLETAVEKRPGSVISVASIVYHVSRLLDGDAKIEFIGKAIAHLLPNCMCQQFNVRLHSQVILIKIFEMLPNDHRRRYQHIYEGVQESLRHGNSMKNSPRIMDDFYFTVFHPNNDYNLEIIYHQLPRLTGLPVDEWLPASMLYSHPVLEDRGNFLNKRSRPGEPAYTDWTTIKVMKQTPRATGDLEEETAASANNSLSDIQKKIIPWKSMAPFSDQLSEISKAALSRKNLRLDDDAGIIVVASLIDRPPNLGGLARTCEIFGAKELVIGSLRYTEDREFQTLSVSAEKWITITEVKPHLLKNYLLEQRAKGWMLVGAEQTANSTNLLEMEFDKKTILLLGNEKDGIPANLIPILDTCVEIPQNGVVRSLNVHVTGAICVWQYLKQHVLT